MGSVGHVFILPRTCPLGYNCDVHHDSIAVSAGRPEGPGQPLNAPITLASNFREGGDYARTHGTPTWAALEDAVGALEGGSATSFASGMAAVAAVLSALRPTTVVVSAASYLGVRALLADLATEQGIQVRMADFSASAAGGSIAALVDGADVVWVESPANPTLEVTDIAAVSAAAHRAGATVVVDNTFATPILAQPLRSGADIVVHSGTKFIGGHSDLLIGLAVTTDGVLHDRLRHVRALTGATPGALEAFLALRGLRTLPLRMQRSQANAQELARRLAQHAGVQGVRYPGFGAVIAFEVVGGATAADSLCGRVQLCVPATSLGGVESTIERRQKYAGDAHVPPGLLRMSVGIEHVDDLWDDLNAALAH
jgi:cystathionine gamma-synthase